MNLTELKAAAYDLIAQLEYLQNKLKETNDQIAEKMKEANDDSQAAA
jgi:uncharacterized coiled-coil protein SlyX